MHHKDLDAGPCVCTNLKMSARLASRAYDEALAPAGLNVAQYGMLVNVARHGPLPLMELARLLELDRTTLYRALSVLEKHGWVRLGGTGAGVAQQVSVTSAGNKVLARARPRWLKAQNGFTARFGERRWEQFLATLRELNRHFEPT